MTPDQIALLIVALWDIFLTFWCYVILEQRDIALKRIKELESTPHPDHNALTCAARHSCGCYLPEDSVQSKGEYVWNEFRSVDGMIWSGKNRA